MKQYESFKEAYIAGLQELLESGIDVQSVTDSRSVGSSFGQSKRDFVEILGHQFTVRNPRTRLFYPNSSKNLRFMFANFIWCLLGKNDVKSISFYNKRGTLFSENGISYACAFGYRLFKEGKLWQHCIDLLTKDQSSRRALIPIFFPSDLITLPLDTSCASSLQFFIREGKLHTILHMRSQSAFKILPYDFFVFSMFQEWMSVLLSIELGSFVYICNSFHYYAAEQAEIEKVLNLGLSTSQMTKMQNLDSNGLLEIEQLESNIRKLKAHNVESLIHSSNLNNYWKDIMLVVAGKDLPQSIIDEAFDVR